MSKTMQKEQFVHFRFYRVNHIGESFLLPKGGVTVFYEPYNSDLHCHDQGPVITISYCSPEELYKKSKGRNVAKGFLHQSCPENGHIIKRYRTQMTYLQLVERVKKIIEMKVCKLSARHPHWDWARDNAILSPNKKALAKRIPSLFTEAGLPIPKEILEEEKVRA